MDRVLIVGTVVIGFILSLAIGHILHGIARFIQHPDRWPLYWIHLLWVGFTVPAAA